MSGKVERLPIEPRAGPPASIIEAVAAIAHPRLDAAQYAALQAGVGWRLSVELIDGEAVVTPPTGGHAASIQGELFYALRRWQESTADGGLLLQDVFVRLPEDQYLAPDIAWWTAQRRPVLSSGAVDVVPDLVVEVLSPATRANDLGAKRELYLDAGVEELWLTDPDAATVVRVRRGAPDERLKGGDQLESAVFPGLALSLSHVFSG